MSLKGIEAMKKWREENPEAAAKSAEALKAWREAGGKPKNPLEKLQENPKSLRLAINAKCWDCSNFQREEILHCPVKTCGLWYVRPYQKKGEEKDEVDAENS